MRIEDSSGPVACSNPIDAAVLTAYWLGAPEHLFGCDQCGARLGEVIALAERVRSVAREGSLGMVVSDAFLKRAAEEGLRVREYAPPLEGKVQCTVTAEGPGAQE